MSTREKVLETTIALLRHRGVAGTGIAAVREESGVARRSIYVNFPDGKEQLVSEATRLAGDRVRSQLSSLEGSPEMVIEALAKHWTDELTRTDFAAGCPVVAATLGHAVSPGGREAAGGAFTMWVEALTEAYSRAGIDASASRASAMTAICAIEGAIIVSQAIRSAGPLAAVAETLASAPRGLERAAD